MSMPNAAGPQIQDPTLENGSAETSASSVDPLADCRREETCRIENTFDTLRALGQGAQLDHCPCQAPHIER